MNSFAKERNHPASVLSIVTSCKLGRSQASVSIFELVQKLHFLLPQLSFNNFEVSSRLPPSLVHLLPPRFAGKDYGKDLAFLPLAARPRPPVHPRPSVAATATS